MTQLQIETTMQVLEAQRNQALNMVAQLQGVVAQQAVTIKELQASLESAKETNHA